MGKPLRQSFQAAWSTNPERASRPTLDLPRAARCRLVNAMDAWRQAADDVEAAARAWRSASALQRSGTADAYFAALDSEQHAATDYELAWETW
jgi:hypothetical protein